MTRGKIILAVLAGAAAGAAIAVMLAPEKGSTVRANLKENASDWADGVLTLVDRLLNEVERRARREDV